MIVKRARGACPLQQLHQSSRHGARPELYYRNICNPSPTSSLPLSSQQRHYSNFKFDSNPETSFLERIGLRKKQYQHERGLSDSDANMAASVYDDSTPAEVKNAKGLHLLTMNTPNGQAVQIFLEELKDAYGLSWTTTLIDIMTNEQKKDWFLKLDPNGNLTPRDPFAGRKTLTKDSQAVFLFWSTTPSRHLTPSTRRPPRSSTSSSTRTRTTPSASPTTSSATSACSGCSSGMGRVRRESVPFQIDEAI